MKKILLVFALVCVFIETFAQKTPEKDSLKTIFLNDEITVTAQRFSLQNFEAPQAISTIRPKYIQQVSPRSTPELLMGTTGVFVQKTNHGGGSPIVRGLMGNQVLLLVDGIRMNNATYRFGPNQYVATIDPLMLERVEVTKGSGSVLYGSDALGGVVQFISKTTSFSDKTTFSGNGYGKWMSAGMEISGRTELSLSSKKVAVLGGFSAKNFGDILAGGNYGFQAPSAYQERAGDIKILVKTSENSTLTANYQHLIQYDVPIYFRVAQDNYLRFSFTPQSRTLGYLRWEKTSENKWLKSLRVTTSLNRSVEGQTQVRVRNNSLEDTRLRDEVNSLGGIIEIHSQPSQIWQMHSGIEYYFDKVKSSKLFIKDGISASQRGSFADGSTMGNLAIFNAHVFDLNKFQFTGGLRFNAVSLKIKDESVSNPSISLQALVAHASATYKIHPNHHLIVGGNTGFRSPNIEDVSKLGNVEANVFEVPNFNLSPERTITMEGGYKFRTTWFSGSLMAYRTDLSNQIVRVLSTFNGSTTYNGIRVYTKENSARSQVYGFEADAEVKINAVLVAYGNWTTTHGQDFTKAQPMRRIPPSFGKIGIRATQNGFSGMAEYIFAGKQDRLESGDKSDIRISSRLVDGATPSWNVVNLYAGYSYKFATLNIGLQNLFNEGYRVHGSGVDGVGRSVWAALRVSF